MGETRKATVAQRIYPHTLKRLDTWAKDHHVDRAEALEMLVPKKRKKDGYGDCRMCDAEDIRNPRGRHNGHKNWCVLWDEKVAGR